ncbi:histidine--tRNA ligase [Gehongia tenuis]|uniref:Histidine--tRNA ligase n=1 Tax=Gehongia tenuis TaxID=2763655 RepID=A0A926D3I2_9FIRM|nr:histidine--tRNA ligase [Gehongia tenuis]MBC8531083.1 histidine--tRNA ligase [Gehongia tenuis]
MGFEAPRGTKDVLPKDSYRWQALESAAREVCRDFGFREMRTPVFEHTELFLRGVGDTTDVVQKEMYTFQDKGERSITLKPEGTAGAARAFIQNKLYNEALPAKMYYLNCPVFRYEKPQAGRYREHHQFGVEVFGAPKATVDAEVISLAITLLERLGVTGLTVNINSIGCRKCRAEYHKALKAFLNSKLPELCETCNQRFETNPMRILDCKEPGCKKALAGVPVVLDYLCGECREHFEALKTCLGGLGIDYTVDPMIVRGLDYYTKTVFEIIAPWQKGFLTVCGGGRYDNLVAECGGPETAGIGFGMGMERLLEYMDSKGLPVGEKPVLDAFVCALGEEAAKRAFRLVYDLRRAGLAVDMDHTGRSLKAQFKYADKLGCRYNLILGEDELKADAIKMRNMTTGDEEMVPLAGVASRLKG